MAATGSEEKVVFQSVAPFFSPCPPTGLRFLFFVFPPFESRWNVAGILMDERVPRGHERFTSGRTSASQLFN